MTDLRVYFVLKLDPRATYEDGKLVSKDVSPAEPKPCAGNDGTTITVGVLTCCVFALGPNTIYTGGKPLLQYPGASLRAT